MKQKITFKKIAKEYPNLEKVSNKYPEIKDIELYVSIEKEDDKRNSIIYKAEYKRLISRHWQIREFDRKFEITWLDIDGIAIKGSGPVLALGTWLYTKTYLNKIYHNKLLEGKKMMHFMTLLERGQEFWTDMLGFGSFETLIKYVENREGFVEKSKTGKSYNLHMPLKAFEKQINARWKK